jgi:hypothetical protein
MNMSPKRQEDTARRTSKELQIDIRRGSVVVSCCYEKLVAEAEDSSGT